MKKNLALCLIIAAAISLMVVCFKAPQYIEGAATGWGKIIDLTERVE